MAWFKMLGNDLGALSVETACFKLDILDLCLGGLDQLTSVYIQFESRKKVGTIRGGYTTVDLDVPIYQLRLV